MSIPVVFGVNYHSAPFELRERLAFDCDQVFIVLQRLINSGVAKEAILLSTCNRTELYCIASDIDFVINAVCDMQNICPRTIARFAYIYHDDQCAKHLFRVVSGLDSMVLGETEIVAQVKDAMNIAKNCEALGGNLAGLFQMALAIEKDVRNHSSINHSAISMGHAIVNYVENFLDKLANRKVMFIGAGQMMQQIAPHFNYLELDSKLVINRTLSKAQMIANKISGQSTELINLPNVIAEYPVVIVCCGGGRAILTSQILNNDIKYNQKKLIIDISMPLVTSADIREYANFTLLTVDDVAKIVDVGIEKRQIAALEAESIINSKLEAYVNWQRKRGLSPLIRELRNDYDKIRLETLALAEKQLLNGQAPDEVLKQMSMQLTNRLLHRPTVNLCSSQGKFQDDLVDLVSYLYDIKI